MTAASGGARGAGPGAPTHVLGGELDAGAVVIRDLTVAPLRACLRLPKGDTAVQGPSSPAYPPHIPSHRARTWERRSPAANHCC